MRIIEAPPGTKCADTFQKVTAAQAMSLRADGFEAIGRYTQNLDEHELQVILAAGLGVFFILEGLGQLTQPTAELGARMAREGVGRLENMGVPRGATLFSDLEGDGRQASDWIAYGNAAAVSVESCGDIAGGYFGAGVGLSSGEMYAMAITRYGKGGSRILDRSGDLAEPSCGWCWVQGNPLDIKRADGLGIDVGALWQDYRGRSVSLVVS